jgi:tRNA modification GTPase
MGASLSRLADTVAAVATAAGPSAIGCVRVSGPDAAAIAARVLDRAPGGQPVRRMVRNTLRDAGGRTVDEVLSVLYRAPHSYTGEDLVEIFCHGGTYNIRKVFETLTAAGCRPADPGEFTRRALLNGKLDLASAEAVNEIVNAPDERSHRAALDQLRGGLTEYLGALRSRLADILAWFEAHLEHPEEDFSAGAPEQFLAEIRKAADDAAAHRKVLESDLLLRDGVRLVLAGRTNAGKSSLFNRLVGRERVLVSGEHGTTRDVVTERMLLEGTAVTLHDTAGFRKGAVGVDAEAALGAERAILGADLVVFVVDGSSPARDEDRELHGLLLREGKRFVTAVNKSDLPGRLDPGGFAGNAGTVRVSAKDGTGVGDLAALAGKELAIGQGDGRSSFCATERNAELFRSLERSLGSVGAALGSGAAYDAVALELRGALEAIDGADGRSAGPDVLDRIFARFCVGK